MSADDFKRIAAEAALERVQPDMTLGLGTGSTAAHFIAGLGARIREGLEVRGVPTSEGARKLAEQAGVPLLIPDETTQIDLAVDGADEIDPALDLIKGGGGAHLREKIIAQSAKKFVVIADESKFVQQLGAFSLPLEITPALWGLTITAVRASLDALGYANPSLSLRPATEDVGAFRTDGGGYVLDCALGRIKDAKALDAALRDVAGVAETGLFVGLADMVILGGPDGVRTIDKQV